MIKLEIFKADGSLYWTEHFNTQVDADKWLAEEKTRTYWKEEYTHQFTETLPPVKTPEEIAAEQVKRDAALQLFQDVKNFDIDAATLAQIKGYLKKERAVVLRMAKAMMTHLESVE